MGTKNVSGMLLAKVKERVYLIVGITSLLYAYLYVVGYFFLKGYFGTWGLNPIDIGFSISDYAAVSIQVVFSFLMWSFISFMVGLELNKVGTTIHSAKMKKILTFLPPVLTVVWVLSLEIYFKDRTINRASLYPLEIAILAFYAWGFLMRAWKEHLGQKVYKFAILDILKNKTIYWPLVVTIILFIVIMPLVSYSTGSFYAESRVDYSYPVFFSITLSPATKPPTARLTTKTALDVPIFKELLSNEGNFYEGLIPIAQKKEFVYFIVDRYFVDKLLNDLIIRGQQMAPEIFGASQLAVDKYFLDYEQQMIKRMISNLPDLNQFSRTRVQDLEEYYLNSNNLLESIHAYLSGHVARTSNSEAKLLLATIETYQRSLKILHERLAGIRKAYEISNIKIGSREGNHNGGAVNGLFMDKYIEKTRDVVIGISKENILFLQYIN